jgi:hypothetical protein
LALQISIALAIGDKLLPFTLFPLNGHGEPQDIPLMNDEVSLSAPDRGLLAVNPAASAYNAAQTKNFAKATSGPRRPPRLASRLMGEAAGGVLLFN